MNNWQRVIICVLLIMSVFAMSLSVYAIDESPSPTPEFDDGLGAVTDELMSRYIWMCLNAWGIHIQYQDMDEFYDEVESQIVTWVLEYLAGLPSSYSINQWIAPWQGDYDYWGNLRLNSSALEDIQDFADWLISKFGLNNNEQEIVNPIYTIGGYNFYQFGHFYEAVGSASQPINSYIAMRVTGSVNAGQLLGYTIVYCPYIDDSVIKKKYKIVAYMTNSTTGNNVIEFLTEDDQIAWGQSSTLGDRQTNVNNMYCMSSNAKYQNETSQYILPKGIYYTAINENEYLNFVRNSNIVEQGDLKIVTYTILTPTIDPTYEVGDSITIVDGEPDYSLIPWDETVTVDNLPAVISTNKIDNPHLEEAYRPIQGLIEYAKDGISLGTALLYELPDEMVYMWYAVIASLVIWGMIKLMREH